MLKRLFLFASVPLALFIVFLAGCNNSSVTAIQVQPSTESLSVGGHAQLTALGVYRQGQHQPSTRDVTGIANWTSSSPDVATVSPSGVVTAVAPGSATITASMNGFPGLVSESAAVTVTGTSKIVSLEIIPSGPGVSTVKETIQFLAFGSTGADVVDLTNQVSWVSSDVKVATIDANGLATGLNPGTTTITAIYTNSDGGVAKTTATLTEGSAPPPIGTQLATLSVYKVGINAGSGTVASYVPATPAVNCGSICTGNYPVGTLVKLVATPGQGSSFGGWSMPCSPDPDDPTNPEKCMVTMLDNETVGAIFN